ncbi:hypothetical protein [Calothrix sp. CCY 0018]|uniref:hypothetical protein n=1 Tax=Calothrix sp. CCY 0018 TaxID=3103864 RepID=UPI0039C5AB12
MTKQQQRDSLNTPKTVIQKSRISGVWRKLFGTWNAIGPKLGQLTLHLRLWRWAAVHHPDFKCFEAGFTKIVFISVSYNPEFSLFLQIQLSLNKPSFYVLTPYLAVGEFCRVHGLKHEVFDDGIPF